MSAVKPYVSIDHLRIYFLSHVKNLCYLFQFCINSIKWWKWDNVLN